MAQNIAISGKVTNISDQPISGVNVILYNQDAKLVTYAITDIAGSYHLKFKKEDAFKLELSHIGYKMQDTLLGYYLSANENHLAIKLQDEIKELKEVIISPPDIEPDSVKFNLQKLNLQENTSLKDILKKIPNFQIDDNGSIIYKGKSIDKIMINGKETFVFQNSIALQNIEKKNDQKAQCCE